MHKLERFTKLIPEEMEEEVNEWDDADLSQEDYGI